MVNGRTLEVKKGEATEILAEVARMLQIPVVEDCQKSYMDLPSPFGRGQVMSYSTNKGLNSLLFECELSRPLTLKLQGNFSQPILFFTVAMGSARVICDAGKFTLSDLQAAIHGAYGPGEYSIELPANEKLLLLVSFIHRKTFFEDIACGILDVSPALLRVIQGGNGDEDHFLFKDIYHLPAIDTLHNIVSHDVKGLLHSAHASAMIFENMFLLLNEYKRIDSAKNKRLIRDIHKINLIRAAEKILVSRLHDTPTIPHLARMVGLNQQTLKTGFRQLYGTTINNYVNDHRLQQASVLISAGGLSISEVANEVGYSNGGYFSRRFKQKYGVTPSKFSEK